MTIESVLYDRLVAFAGLTALIGTRAYPGQKLPQNVRYPAVNFFWVDEDRISAMGVDTGIVRSRLQVGSWDEDQFGCWAVREQVKQALTRWSTTSGTTIDDIFFLDGSDIQEPEGTHEEEVRHFTSDFDVIYRE